LYPVNTYIVSPKNNKNPDKAIVFLTDVFGIFSNAQLLADEFANNGYLTVIPDLFQGDQIKVSDMESGKADLPAWLPKHQPANVDPVVESTIKYVRETLGVKKVGAVGYCFGGKVSVVGLRDPSDIVSGTEMLIDRVVRHPPPQARPD
jgi:dienelactone hydrolase